MSAGPYPSSMNRSPALPSDPAMVAEDLRIVVGRLARRLRATYTIPPHQFSVLNTIARTGPQTASRLATLEFVRPQTMAHTLQQLDEAKFVMRHPDPDDGRQTLISLSDSGRVAIDHQRRETTGWLSAAIDQKLDADEQLSLGVAITLLGRLIQG
jgi:DNA-binding MarR family transcriptional regulator